MPEELKAHEDELEVDISYSEEMLFSKLSKYKLSAKHIISKVYVNQQHLNNAHTTNNALLALVEEIKRWQLKQNAASFTSNINQLIFLWLNAIEDGANTCDILDLLKSFKIKSHFYISSTSKLHLFLFELVTETVTKFQKLNLQYVQNYDANTRLPNTKQITTDLQKLTEASKEEFYLGLLSIYFQASRNKLIFSKKITEALNKQIAALLKQNVSKKVQLYFDEDLQFDLLIPDADLTELNLISAKISRIFQEMLNIDNQSILMTPLMGYASVANKINAVNDLQHKTKLALESAIEKQKPLAIYDDALQKSLTDKRLIESKVLDSFANDNFTLYFQPILDLKSLKCTGAELLLRWSEKAGYSTYPSVTIEILNKVGKGELFTRWLINSACRFASELINQHHLNIYLTINLRAEDLYDIELPHLLIQAVNLWKIKPKDIILEITENGILEYNEDSDSVINQLSKLGFKFALDDFGTGFSSLTRLRRMPIDLIKIDQSFVRDINHSKEDFEIVQSIATLADSLGKEVLAEGIEDKHCLSQLKKLKIDKGQGFYFSKPMPYEQFIEWVKSH